MQPEPTSVLFVLALALYLTKPTWPACVLYAAVTVFFCFETFPKRAQLLFCEVIYCAAAVYVLATSRGSGYIVPVLSLAGSQYYHCKNGDLFN
jgi:hypothetical protein